jgi:hypothetical protein
VLGEVIVFDYPEARGGVGAVVVELEVGGCGGDNEGNGADVGLEVAGKDAQLEDNGGVAAIVIGVGVDVGARVVVGVIAESVGIVGADGVVQSNLVVGIDGEVDGNQAVAALG